MKAPATFLLAAVIATASAQQAPAVKRVPPAGVEVPAADRTEIETGLKQLAAEIAKLKAQPKLADEVPNVEIFHKSADWALRYDEIFDVKQIPIAKEHIQQGLARAAALSKGTSPWNTASGLVVRAYRSKIDGSVQPYGLLIPEGLKPGAKVPLHFWCHGRGEKLSELSFIDGSQKNKGEFTPEGSIVCFLYGRYCNANKFAGEVDLFEALDDIKKHYPIDEHRLVMRGFSMGGAAAWQFGTHHSGMFAAVAPGAGFAETAEFHKVFAEGKEAPPWWEQVLWRWYDCTTMAANLANTTTVAYSGEIDGQKQAADIMIRYAEKEGIKFPHIIGPQTPHKYHPDSKVEINKLVDAAVAKGREAFPKKVRHVTYTTLYPQNAWVTLLMMDKHWERADISAEVTEQGKVNVQTKNAAGIALDVFAKDAPQITEVVIDGTAFDPSVNRSAGRTSFTAYKLNGKWLTLEDWRRANDLATKQENGAIQHRKVYGLVGPIDNAFTSKFVFVRPTGKPINPIVGQWVAAEMQRAITQWRQVFRGDVEVIDDVALSKRLRAVMKDSNIVLWGDPSSNLVLKTLLEKESGYLPLKWTDQVLELGTQKVDPSFHVPILIYPSFGIGNYFVLNSGPTFREAAALNNSDQTPKLPDWAVVDLRTPPGPKWPGQIVDAGFFDENWR